MHRQQLSLKDITEARWSTSGLSARFPNILHVPLARPCPPHAMPLGRNSKDYLNLLMQVQQLLNFHLPLQSELLAVIAEKNIAAERATHRRHNRDHNVSDGPQEAEVRRVRQRRE